MSSIRQKLRYQSSDLFTLYRDNSHTFVSNVQTLLEIQKVDYNSELVTLFEFCFELFDLTSLFLSRPPSGISS